MKMLDCPKCQRRTGFKRSLGFGTFFAALITLGLWLLVIPLYPLRCLRCGTTSAEVTRANVRSMFNGNQSVSPRFVFAVLGTVLTVLVVAVIFAKYF